MTSNAYVTTTTSLVDPPRNHTGHPVAPRTPWGTPFRYALVERDRRRITWALLPDAILAHLIDDYPLGNGPTRATAAEREIRRIQLRVEHMWSTLLNEAAQAIVEGAPEEVVTVFQSVLDKNTMPTSETVPHWDYPRPLGLPEPFFRDGRAYPPSGNVVILDARTPEGYLMDLQRLGAVEVWTHPSVDDLVTVRTVEPGEIGAASPFSPGFPSDPVSSAGPASTGR